MEGYKNNISFLFRIRKRISKKCAITNYVLYIILLFYHILTNALNPDMPIVLYVGHFFLYTSFEKFVRFEKSQTNAVSTCQSLLHQSAIVHTSTLVLFLFCVLFILLQLGYFFHNFLVMNLLK